MRSLLFVPGNSAKMMAKAAASGADVIVFDLEDAVHPDSKLAARSLVAAALANSAGVAPARYVRAAQRDLTRIIPVCTETPGRHALAAAKSWAHPRLAALDASATGCADRWSHAGCAAPCAGAPHHDVIRSRLISDCIAGPAPALDVTGKPHMAKIAQLFSICSEELMMGHPSWAVSWLWAEITALRGVGEPTCQLTSSTTQLRTLRFSAPVAWDFCQCSSETSSPIGAWPRSTSSMSAPTAAAKSGRL